MMMDDKGTKTSLLNTLNGGRGWRGDGGGGRVLMTHTFGITKTQPSVRRGQMAN